MKKITQTAGRNVFGESITTAALQIGNAVPIDLVKASGAVFKEAIRTIKLKRSREKNGKFL